jgi:hypothetical protein
MPLLISARYPKGPFWRVIRRKFARRRIRRRVDRTLLRHLYLLVLRNEVSIRVVKSMGYSEDSTSRFSFLSFVLSVLGFFLFGFFSIGLYIGVAAIILSFVAEDLFKEKSMWQYLTIIIAVVDILGALAGWNIVKRI